MQEFRFVGSHAGELDSGRPLEPGSYTGPIDEAAAKNNQMIEEGTLIPVPKGTAAKVDKANEAARKKSEANDDGEDS